MTHHLKRDLVETLIQAQMDDTVRVVVFTGSGQAFFADDGITGHPVGQYAGQVRVPDIPGQLSQPLNKAIRHLDKLKIAALNGLAFGAGFSLALACDFLIASEKAHMGSARRRRIVSAQEALDLGLVHEVVPPAELMDRTLDLARELAR